MTPPPLPDTKLCPFCAEKIQASANKCRYCLRTLPSPLPPGHSDLQVTSTDPYNITITAPIWLEIKRSTFGFPDHQFVWVFYDLTKLDDGDDESTLAFVTSAKGIPLRPGTRVYPHESPDNQTIEVTIVDTGARCCIAMLALTDPDEDEPGP